MDISDSERYVENFYGSSSVYRKVLGLNWDTGADDFIFDFEIICRTAEKLDVTKRNILRLAVNSSYFKNFVEINWNGTEL